jgi:hypothetical protein
MKNNLKGFAILMGMFGILALPEKTSNEGLYRLVAMVAGGVAVTHVFTTVNSND